MSHSAKKAYLIHGQATNRHVSDDPISCLPADWQICTLDLPGRSDAPFAEPLDITMIAETFAAQIDAPVRTLGWSLGGLAALYFAAPYSGKIHSLCLTTDSTRLTVNTDYPERLTNPALGKVVGAFRQNYVKHIKQFLQLQLLHAPDSAEILRRILPNLFHHSASAVLQAVLDAVNQADARPLLTHTRTPSLSVSRQKDAITSPRIGGYLDHRLTDNELILIEKAAYVPFLSHAGEFAERYRGFVEKAV